MKNLLFPIQAFEAMEGYGVTGFGGVPATLGLLASHPAAARTRQDSLRYILSAGGPLAPSVVQRLKTAFPGADLFNNYGCTEIGPRATSVNYTEFPDRIGSIGRAIRGVEVRIVRQDLTLAVAGETGEVVLTGASLMQGYYRDPGATARKMSRWGFHTGDFAYVDEDGFLYYEGRHDDIFKCAGEKLSAREVEDVLLEHEAVLEAAVTSMADAALGAVPIAHVVCRAECAPSAEELQVFCARRLSRYKVPRQILFVDALQRTATGKVQKFRLREARA
jgi:feruloyl-CoA synthase